MLRLLVLLALLAAACPAPAYAQSSIDGFSNCPAVADLPGSAGTSTVRAPDDRACFDFDSDVSPGDESGGLYVLNGPAYLCLDADLNGTGGSAVVEVQHCITEEVSDATCSDTGDANLTLSTSNTCAAVRRGTYRLEIETAPSGTEDARVETRRY